MSWEGPGLFACGGGGGVLKGDMVVGSSLVTESESLCGANRVWGGEGRGGHQGLSG